MAPEEQSITVVIPCYNAERWIGRAIESVLRQNVLNLQLIFVDDGSTDSSADVVRSFASPVTCISQPNAGAASARNSGLAKAGGSYVLFLDADDYLEPGTLAPWIGDVRRQDGDVLLGPFANDVDGKLIPGISASDIISQNRSPLQAWLEGWYTPTCSVLWRREFLNSVGGWNAGLVQNDDGELAMRAMLLGARVATSRKGLGVYFQHDSNTRISRQRGTAALAREMSVLDNLFQTAKTTGQFELVPSFAKAYYGVAYHAYATGFPECGEVALEKARSLGLKGHVGSPAHVILASALGLRNKLRLTAVLRGRKMAPLD